MWGQWAEPRENPAPPRLFAYWAAPPWSICIRGGANFACCAGPVLGGGGGVPVITSPRPLGPPRLTGGPVQPSEAFPLPNSTGEVFGFFVKNGLSVPFLYKTQGSSRGLDHQKPTAAT